MSQALTAPGPLWKPGNRGNIEFLSSWNRLQKEDPQTYGIVEQREGFTCQDNEYEYKVGMNRYGLWLSRRKMGMEGLRQIEEMGKPPQRPDLNLTPPPTSSAFDVNVILMAIGKLTDSINLLTLSHLCSTPEEKEDIRKKCLQ